MSAFRDRLEPERLVTSIGAARAGLGGALLLAPTTAVRMLGVDSATAKRMAFLARMTAARDIALGLGTLASSGTPQAGRWLAAGAAADAVVALAITAAARRGITSGLGAVGSIATAVAAAALGSWAAAELTRRR